MFMTYAYDLSTNIRAKTRTHSLELILYTWNIVLNI